MSGHVDGADMHRPRSLQLLLLTVLFALLSSTAAQAQTASSTLLLNDRTLGHQQRAELARLGVVGTLATDHGRLLQFASPAAAARADARIAGTEAMPLVRASTIPDDPGLDRQWGLVNRGVDFKPFDGRTRAFSGAATTYGADINAPLAWDLSRGAGVKVAVVDNGVDTAVAELAARVGAGAPGWNFADGQAAQVVTADSHATNVAGTLAAESGNGAGVAGVAPAAGIVPVQVLSNATSSGTLGNVYAGMDYAADQPGVRVVNLSLGVNAPSGAVLCEPIARHPDVLFVAAAGNEDSDNDTSPVFPANCPEPNVISVGASTRLDRRASFSNYGTDVDLFAPGKDIVSLVRGGGAPAAMSGSSMAVPFVSGAAALLLSAAPELTPTQVARAILGSVDRLPALSGLAATGGRLNAYAALTAIGATPPTAAAAGTAGWRALPAPALTFKHGRHVMRDRQRGLRVGLAPTMAGTTTVSLQRLGGRSARVRTPVSVGRPLTASGNDATALVAFDVRSRAQGKALRPGRYRLTAITHTRYGDTAPDGLTFRVAR